MVSLKLLRLKKYRCINSVALVYTVDNPLSYHETVSGVNDSATIGYIYMIKSFSQWSNRPSLRYFYDQEDSLRHDSSPYALYKS